MYRSLVKHAGPITLYVLCFDDFTSNSLQRLNQPGLIPIPLGSFEAGDQDLVRTKKDRTRVEYFFTCSPSLPRYILRAHPEIELLSYVDADLFFNSSPEPIFSELDRKSILIIGHKFPRQIEIARKDWTIQRRLSHISK